MTYSGHPLACAAAVGAIRAMRDEGTVEAAARLGRELLGPRLRSSPSGIPRGGRTRHRRVVDRRAGPGPGRRESPSFPSAATGDANAPMAAFTKACLGRDVIPLVLGNRVHVAPPLNVSDADLELALSVLDEALTEADAFVA